MSNVRLFRSFKRQTAEQRHAETLERLRRVCQGITSREHFEAIVAQATDPDATRALLEPMLPAGLRCCAHSPFEPHTPTCPVTRARVEDDEIARFEGEGAPAP